MSPRENNAPGSGNGLTSVSLLRAAATELILSAERGQSSRIVLRTPLSRGRVRNAVASEKDTPAPPKESNWLRQNVQETADDDATPG